MPNSTEETVNREHRIKLTKRSVESVKPAAPSVVRYDDKLAGFAVRVMATGRRFYFVRYRNKHGRSRWFTIGEHGKGHGGRRARQGAAHPADGGR
jgi:hypothetical protein